MMASFYMEGEALVWFQEGKDVGVIRNWEALVQALLIKYGTPADVDPMEALTRLRQTLTMTLYRENSRLYLIGLGVYLPSTNLVVF